MSCLVCSKLSSKEYSYFTITKSEKVKINEIENQSGPDLLLKNGTLLKPDLAVKMGFYYLFWLYRDSGKPVIDDSNLCSKKCAIEFAIDEDALVWVRGTQLVVSKLITPYQEEIDDYRREYGIPDREINT
jgi:hypothetical protein